MLILGLWSLLGCQGSEEPQPVETTFVTFNAGLATGFVPAAEARLPLVAQALEGLEADVLCLQEVWTPEQASTIVSSLEGQFSHIVVPEARQSSDAFCEPGQMDAALDCMQTECDVDCVDAQTECILDNCGLPIFTMGLDCTRCAFAKVGNSAEEIANSCYSDPVEYAYDGSFGLVLASKYEILEQQELVFDSTSNSRMALIATLDHPAGPLTVGCTHLTAVFDSIPYPRAGSENWETEQKVQVDELVAATAGFDEMVLMGDFNTGPGVGGFLGEVAAHYQTLIGGGFSNPYLVNDPLECTYCADNPLELGNADDASSRIIDHVLVKGNLDVMGSDRVLDEWDYPSQTCDTPINPGALSDHYGVSVTVLFNSRPEE